MREPAEVSREQQSWVPNPVNARDHDNLMSNLLPWTQHCSFYISVSTCKWTRNEQLHPFCDSILHLTLILIVRYLRYLRLDSPLHTNCQIYTLFSQSKKKNHSVMASPFTVQFMTELFMDFLVSTVFSLLFS